MVIDLNTLIQRNENKFLANKIGEEMVMMDMEAGDFITMNSVGADIWALSENPVTVKDLTEKLLMQYDLTAEKCIEDTLQFLQNTEEQNLFNVLNSVVAE